MMRWFNDGTRVGIEFDSPKEAEKFAQNDEAIKSMKEALSKLEDGRFEKVADLTKSVMSEMYASQGECLHKVTAPIEKKVSKTNTLTKVALGVSITNLIITAADKGYELYKKYKSSKKPAAKK